jgi:DNA-binding protein H-NS
MSCISSVNELSLRSAIPDMRMRKPRDIDAQLKALTDKTKALEENKLLRLGELVVATCADTLGVETLAGVLLAAVATKDKQQLSAWKKVGEEVFQNGKRAAAKGTAAVSESTAKAASGQKPLPSEPRQN